MDRPVQEKYDLCMADRLALKAGQKEELRRFLEQEPVSGLFLLGLLSSGLENVPGQFFIAAGSRQGEVAGPEIGATAYLGDGGLFVPEGSDRAALEQLAAGLQRHWRRVRVLVGPRQPTDLLWQGWFEPASEPPPRLWRDHQLYCLEPIDLGPGEEERVLYRAVPPDLDELAVASAAMRLEELGDDVLRTNPVGFRQRVMERIRSGSSWIVRDEQGIAFKADVGTICR
ncbi:MAG: DUF4081 domain-containing protein, partial [Deltaproteobacteria bacterium]|nr:DUF4081 domain-containing protein [Deltaproteobacteria bacterium]